MDMLKSLIKDFFKLSTFIESGKYELLCTKPGDKVNQDRRQFDFKPEIFPIESITALVK